MSSELLINVHPTQTRVAYVENKALVDLKIDKKVDPTIVGSIYRGKVMRILPGMQAAFVDIGLDRAAFLYVGDIQGANDEVPPLVDSEDDGESAENSLGDSGNDAGLSATKVKIQDLIKQGQFLLVQVAKDPLGTKGSRITMQISLPGRHIVFMPTAKQLGISRRIEDGVERERLRQAIEKLKPEGGIIVRTAAEGATSEDLAADLDYLNRVWKDIQSSYEKRKNPGLVHAELDVELRSLRDLLDEKIERVVVDDPRAHKKIINFVAQFLPKYKNKIVLHREEKPLFDFYDLDLEVQRALSRRIWLKSGGYIVIDEAEALVVIDVNTGRYVGKRDLEDTIVTTNIEAAREIAHQLRIRNCGGIIVIDFIDMENEAHRAKVLGIFKEELSKDKAKTIVSPISELGLVEMTRKRIRPSLIASLCEACPYCEGNGYVKQKVTVAYEIFRHLDRDAARFRGMSSTVVRCKAEVADWIYAEEGEALEAIEMAIGHAIVFKVEPSFHIEQFEIESL